MKIYITGIGAISGIGNNVSENIASLREGRHGMGKVSLFQTVHDLPVSEVKLSNAELKQMLSLDVDKIYSRTALLGMVAAKEALKDSGIDVQNTDLRIGLISSTSVGGMDRTECFYHDFLNDPTSGDINETRHHDCGDSSERIADYLGIHDFVTTISTACSSAGNAIMMGARMIRNGILDAVVVGGVDPLSKFTFNGFNSLMILDNRHCRPYDDSRSGLNLGEGAGYLVLQSEQSVQKKAYCQLSGYANSNDAYHQTASSPEGDGPYMCMKGAIKMAGIETRDIDYINVHGTGTPNNDLSESKAMIRLFEEHIPPFSSVKPFIGHTLGASEGIEAVYSVLSISEGMMYPNLNFSAPISETSLVPVTSFQQGLYIRHVLSNSFGFGGNGCSLLFSATDL